jgi:HPt (histidine-containing phosphotransfer) domain-containing protein
MQTKHIQTIIDKMESFFGDNPDEIRNLINLLHQALSDHLSALTDDSATNIRITSHRIASELLICGADKISAQAKTIEQDATAGLVISSKIKALVYDLELVIAELAAWIAADQS